MTYPVALANCPEYEEKAVLDAAAQALDAAGVTIPAGARVLVKPNLVSAANAGLSTTHPAVVVAACRLALDAGAREVLVGDSPAFGSAASVARASGLAAALAQGLPRGAPVRVVSLGRPRSTRLPCGLTIGISAVALEADFLLNVPRLKAHNQLLVTAAVKNLFGCVAGCRKAIAHAVHGDQGDRFRQLLLDVALALPSGASLLDGIVAMHVRGPVKGEPFPLGLVAAAAHPVAHAVAMDAAVYAILSLPPHGAPLGRTAQERGLPQADPANLAYPLLRPQDFDAAGFCLPALEPETFHPWRVIKGRFKSLCARYV